MRDCRRSNAQDAGAGITAGVPRATAIAADDHHQRFQRRGRRSPGAQSRGDRISSQALRSDGVAETRPRSDGDQAGAKSKKAHVKGDPMRCRTDLNTKMRLGAIQLAVFVSLWLCIAGCGGGGPRLASTPNVLRDGSGSALLARVPEQYRKVEIPIIYITDREKYGQNGTWPLYGFGRSATVAYGTASVGLKPMPSWEELAKASGSSEGEKWEMSVFDLREVGSVVLSPDSLEVKNGGLQFKPEIQAALDLERDGFHKLLGDQLATTPKKDVYLYIHGVANYFESPVLRAATMWHFMGRQGAFIAYSWPAGKGGLFGYFYDRESGEFTVLHLKRVLKLIASTPGVERLHIICHSRGGDITTTALRELNVEYMAKGESAQKALKLQTLVLAAPDLDAEVFSTRLMFESMATIAKQIVVYCSEKDKAVGMADKLFHSK